MDKQFNAYTLETFPLTKARNKAALICPFWADVDMNNGGDLWSRETKAPALLQRASTEGLFDIEHSFSNILIVDKLTRLL